MNKKEMDYQQLEEKVNVKMGATMFTSEEFQEIQNFIMESDSKMSYMNSSIKIVKETRRIEGRIEVGPHRDREQKDVSIALWAVTSDAGFFRGGSVFYKIEDDDKTELLMGEVGVHFHYPRGWELGSIGAVEQRRFERHLVQEARRHRLRVSGRELRALFGELLDLSLEDSSAEKAATPELGDFFKNPLQSEVNDFSSVVWHPSAGLDWSPVVFYSKGYLSRKQDFQNLTPATFHVMTNLGIYEEELLQLLKSEDRICFEDEMTCLRILDFEHVQLKKRSLCERPSPDHFYGKLKNDVFQHEESDGILATMEIRCKTTDHVELVPLLYLLAENIATYEHFVKSGLFSVRHIKVVCEGLAFGGCRRPLLDYISESALGLDTLESVWSRKEGQASKILEELSRAIYLERVPMPMCFDDYSYQVRGKKVN